MTRLRLYIAGPMTGYDDFNYPAFFAAADQLQAAGYPTINPADIGLHPQWTREDYLRVSLKRLMDHAQGVALLPGWQRSGGARLEAHTAEQLGLPVRPLAVWLALADRHPDPGSLAPSPAASGS